LAMPPDPIINIFIELSPKWLIVYPD